MTVAWTQHRFAGGLLALDTTNTVVHRCDPSRRFDRFDDPAEIQHFAAAASILRACASAVDGRTELSASPGAPFGEAGAPLPFETALAVSALSLLDGASLRKLKVCPNCNWLFLDKSRNSSRLWCDMAVCGNRAKARQHYRRQKLQREKTDG